MQNCPADRVFFPWCKRPVDTMRKSTTTTTVLDSTAENECEWSNTCVSTTASRRRRSRIERLAGSHCESTTTVLDSTAENESASRPRRVCQAVGRQTEGPPLCGRRRRSHRSAIRRRRSWIVQLRASTTASRRRRSRIERLAGSHCESTTTVLDSTAACEHYCKSAKTEQDRTASVLTRRRSWIVQLRASTTASRRRRSRIERLACSHGRLEKQGRVTPAPFCGKSWWSGQRGDRDTGERQKGTRNEKSTAAATQADSAANVPLSAVKAALVAVRSRSSCRRVVRRGPPPPKDWVRIRTERAR